MTARALANLRVALDASVIAFTIFFQALGALASASLFMCITNYFISECPGVLGENCCTSSLYSSCFDNGVEAVEALATRQTEASASKAFTVQFQALTAFAVA
jgi:hypothetical protein